MPTFGVIAFFCEPHHGIFLLVNLRPRLAAVSLVDRKCDDHARGAMPAFRLRLPGVRSGLLISPLTEMSFITFCP